MIEAKCERRGHDGNPGRHEPDSEGVAEKGTAQDPADDDLGDRDDEHLSGSIRQNDRIGSGELLANQEKSRKDGR